MKKLTLAVTPGDPAGIGPELVWKILSNPAEWMRRADLLCVGARAPFEKMGAPIIEVESSSLVPGIRPPKKSRPFIWLLPAPPNRLPGYQAGWSIQKSVNLVRSGVTAALVTGPISKQRLQEGGYNYPGHTEFLAQLCGAKSVTMMLANDTLRVSLVTTHIALKKVSSVLSQTIINDCLENTAKYLRLWWGIKRPKIAVAALNPHAGEAGIFGNEEIKIISPAIQAFLNRHSQEVILDGPWPADTLFSKHLMTNPKDRYDAIVCMYHDQGLIPVKLIDFPNTVNITLGLPIIRTSVDHGVGFDIVGSGRADPSSLRAAIKTAIDVVTKSGAKKSYGLKN